MLTFWFHLPHVNKCLGLYGRIFYMNKTRLVLKNICFCCSQCTIQHITKVNVECVWTKFWWTFYKRIVINYTLNVMNTLNKDFRKNSYTYCWNLRKIPVWQHFNAKCPTKTLSLWKSEENFCSLASQSFRKS